MPCRPPHPGRLLAATAIVTGLSPEIAQTRRTIGVELGTMNAAGDLQGGIEQAERLLGYKAVTLAEVSLDTAKEEETWKSQYLSKGKF